MNKIVSHNIYTYINKAKGYVAFSYLRADQVSKYNSPKGLPYNIKYDENYSTNIYASGLSEKASIDEFNNPNLAIEVRPMLSCNYHCEHCCAQLGGYYKDDITSYVKNCTVLNIALKRAITTYVKKGTQVDICLLGGEISLVPFESFEKGCKALFDGLPKLGTLKMLTNGSAPYSTYKRFLQVLQRYCNKAVCLVSYHDSIVKTKLQRQSLFRKLLLLSTYNEETISTNTVDYRNQKEQGAFVWFSLAYNGRLITACPPLRTPRQVDEWESNYTSGWVMQRSFVRPWDIAIKTEVCNGFKTHFQLYIEDHKLFWYSQCLSTLTGFKLNGVNTKVRYPSIKDTATKEEIESFVDSQKYLYTNTSCNRHGKLHTCNVCEKISTVSYATAKKYKIEYFNLLPEE